MAELVEMRMEKSIIEYEQMKTLKFFDDTQIKDLIRKRTEFENKLQKSPMLLQDLLDYISFENKIQRLVRERTRFRQEGLKLFTSVTLRIRRLYDLAVTRFPSEPYLWEKYISHNHGLQPTRILVQPLLMQMLQFHGQNPAAWLKAIRYERAHSTKADKNHTVRQLLLQAIHRHPTCIHLCVELVNHILSSEEPEEVRKESALQAYASCEKGCPGVIVYHLAMLKETKRHEGVEYLQRKILDDMKKLYSTNPIFWHTIAQREMAGLITYNEPNEIRPNLRERLEKCVETYDKAVAKLDTIEMWSFYLDAMIELNRGSNTRILHFRRLTLARTFNKAINSGRMGVEHYTTYFKILYALNAANETFERALPRAVELHKNSAVIWKLYIQHYIRKNDFERASAVFRDMRKELANGSAPVWEVYIGYLRGLPDKKSTLKQVFEDALLHKQTDFNQLKCSYLEWTNSVGGIIWARRLFRRACQLGVANMDMSKQMYALEESQTPPNLEEWRKNIDLTVMHFEIDSESWTMKAKFETDHGDPLRVNHIILASIAAMSKHCVNSPLPCAM